MPRLKKTDVEQRETFVLTLFRENPKLSAAKANEKVKAKFGSQMRAQKVYELRAKAEAESKKEVTAAGRKPGRKTKQARGGRKPVVQAARKAAATVEFVPVLLPVGGEAEAGIIRKALDHLRNSGAINLKVAHSTGKYAVIDVA